MLHKHLWLVQFQFWAHKKQRMSVLFRKPQWLEGTSLFDCTWEYFDWWYTNVSEPGNSKHSEFMSQLAELWVHTGTLSSDIHSSFPFTSIEECSGVCVCLCVSDILAPLYLPITHSNTDKLLRTQNSHVPFLLQLLLSLNLWIERRSQGLFWVR